MNALGNRKQKIFIGLLLLSAACSDGGDGDDAPAAAPAAEEAATTMTVTGSIKSIAGAQSEMNQWLIGLVEYGTGLTRVGLVNAIGNYSIENIVSNKVYTLVLLDPQFKLSAVISTNSETEGTVRQAFKVAGAQLPALVHNGPIVNFADSTNITWEAIVAKDVDNDLIPDGREAALFLADGTEAEAPGTDTDGDGTADAVDVDMDGDGLINAFDQDDDGDGLADIFDGDANGDSIVDLLQTTGDLYFTSDLQYVSVQIVQDIQDDQSFQTDVLVTSKLLGAAPESLKLRGPSGVFDGATSVITNPTSGATTEEAWDSLLVDDGANEDGGAGDTTYARRIRLATGKLPKAGQVFFLTFESKGEDDAVILSDYPYMIPDVSTGVISGAFAVDTRTVTLTGTPFGSVTEYRWSVHIYDSTGVKVYASAPVAGSVSTFVVPAGVLEAGVTYSARIVATTPERIPSFPSWVVRSASFPL